jgi:4,5:9,10-diseco-3-hydroxy-5,9,17-trioxoandrosta-1(10),2-diene-4-oate hydrolase
MSSASQNSDATAAAFSEHVVQIDGTQIRYLEAGQGNPVIVLDGSGALGQSRLYSLLARRFRVITFDIPGPGASLSPESTAMRNLAHMLARAAIGIGLERYALVSIAAATPVALWQAIDAPERIEGMVLVSPTALSALADRTVTDSDDHELESRLADVRVATLVLLGTEDRVVPPETGRTYAQGIPKCYYVLVYDAGHGLETERPDVLFETMRDFLERREGFVVNRNSTLLNP